MTEPTSHTGATSSPPDAAARVAPKSWRGDVDAWRWARRLDMRYVNGLLRLRSAAVLPSSFQDRILAMGIPRDIMSETLRSIRNLAQWADAWIETAQRFLGDYRRQISGSQRYDAAQARLLAAMCYHVAQLLPGPDPRTLDHCRAAAATLAGQALPEVMPHARKIDIPWRNHTLPAILLPGPDSAEPSGLVVTFNGTSTTKEEMLRWTGPFAQAGLAILLVDTPGTGEARALGPPAPDQDDLLDGVFDMLRSYPAIDARKVAVLGISLGGNLALRCLANDRRIAGAAMVTPPYDPARWIDRVSPLEREELIRLFRPHNHAELEATAAAFSLEEVAPGVQRPILIFGGGRDLVVPPADATLLAAQLGPMATLDWYPRGGHALFGQIPAWTTDAAYWIGAVQQRQSTRVDDVQDLVEEWRNALYQQPVREDARDESMESTRLLSPEEAAQNAERDAELTGSYDDEYSRAFDDDFERRRRDGDNAGEP